MKLPLKIVEALKTKTTSDFCPKSNLILKKQDKKIVKKKKKTLNIIDDVYYCSLIKRVQGNVQRILSPLTVYALYCILNICIPIQYSLCGISTSL